MPGHIPEHKLNALARMKVEGFDAEKMADTVSLSVKTVRGLLKNGNVKFNKLVEAHENKVIHEQVLHRMWMADHIDVAEQAVLNAIEGNDKRLAAENAWKLLDKACPTPKEKLAPAEFNLNIKAETEIKDAVIQIGQQVLEVTKVLSTQDPMKHVRTGAEALPRAISVSVGPPEAENEKLELVESDA